MPQPKDDLSKSLVVLDQHKTLIASIELSLKSWLVGGIVPGIERDPLKKLVPDEEALLKLLHRCVMKPSRPAAPSRALSLPSRRAATAFGWHVGCARVV